ncbi:MAG: hypothetical protein FWE03_04905, partial [Firmicutes bacterium]|nr:hypothetical protein [Bacillota bacterium]
DKSRKRKKKEKNGWVIKIPPPPPANQTKRFCTNCGQPHTGKYDLCYKCHLEKNNTTVSLSTKTNTANSTTETNQKKCKVCALPTNSKFDICFKCYSKKQTDAPLNTKDTKKPFIKACFNDTDFRKFNQANIQAEDGHYVRSRAEVIIDNWLFRNNYRHIYEKRVIMESDLDAVVICDFYLPDNDIYLEFWGLENDPKYEERKAQKIKMYNENKLARIDLYATDVDRPDDLLAIKIKKKVKELENAK